MENTYAFQLTVLQINVLNVMICMTTLPKWSSVLVLCIGTLFYVYAVTLYLTYLFFLSRCAWWDGDTTSGWFPLYDWRSSRGKPHSPGLSLRTKHDHHCRSDWCWYRFVMLPCFLQFCKIIGKRNILKSTFIFYSI